MKFLTDAIDPLAVVKRRVVLAAGAVAAIAFLGLGAHDRRVDFLRGRYLDRLNSVHIVLADAGMGKTKPGEEANAVKLVAAQRDKAIAERDTARTLVGAQSDSIDRLHTETEQYAREAEANRKLIAATVKERNAWIARAHAAETRTERLSAEQEVAECEAVLDDLRDKGF